MLLVGHTMRLPSKCRVQREPNKEHSSTTYWSSVNLGQLLVWPHPKVALYASGPRKTQQKNLLDIYYTLVIGYSGTLTCWPHTEVAF